MTVSIILVFIAGYCLGFCVAMSLDESKKDKLHYWVTRKATK